MEISFVDLIINALLGYYMAYIVRVIRKDPDPNDWSRSKFFKVLWYCVGFYCFLNIYSAIGYVFLSDVIPLFVSKNTLDPVENAFFVLFFLLGLPVVLGVKTMDILVFSENKEGGNQGKKDLKAKKIDKKDQKKKNTFIA